MSATIEVTEATKKSGRYPLEYLDVELLQPNNWNVQHMNDVEFNRLVDEVDKLGITVPLSVVPMEDGSYTIIGGEHRWKAARLAGLTEVPCLLLSTKQWKDEDLQKMASVRMNVIHGSINPAKFASLYAEMSEKYGAENVQGSLGFTDAAVFQKLVNQVNKGLKKNLPPSMHKAVDQATKQAKTIDDLSKIIQHLFAKYGDTVNQSFMIFAHGNREHIYIAMSRKTKKHMDQVLTMCRESGEDINEFLEPLIEAFGRTAEERLLRMKEKGTGEKNVEGAGFADIPPPTPSIVGDPVF